jgi:hypothetical protein
MLPEKLPRNKMLLELEPAEHQATDLGGDAGGWRLGWGSWRAGGRARVGDGTAGALGPTLLGALPAREQAAPPASHPRSPAAPQAPWAAWWSAGRQAASSCAST